MAKNKLVCNVHQIWHLMKIKQKNERSKNSISHMLSSTAFYWRWHRLCCITIDCGGVERSALWNVKYPSKLKIKRNFCFYTTQPHLFLKYSEVFWSILRPAYINIMNERRKCPINVKIVYRNEITCISNSQQLMIFNTFFCYYIAQLSTDNWRDGKQCDSNVQWG